MCDLGDFIFIFKMDTYCLQMKTNGVIVDFLSIIY